MCADALSEMGPLVVSLALLISVVLLYALTGLVPLTVALACALAAVAASHWLGLDRLVVVGTVFER